MLDSEGRVSDLRRVSVHSVGARFHSIFWLTLGLFLLESLVLFAQLFVQGAHVLLQSLFLELFLFLFLPPFSLFLLSLLSDDLLLSIPGLLRLLFQVHSDLELLLHFLFLGPRLELESGWECRVQF